MFGWRPQWVEEWTRDGGALESRVVHKTARTADGAPDVAGTQAFRGPRLARRTTTSIGGDAGALHRSPNHPTRPYPILIPRPDRHRVGLLNQSCTTLVYVSAFIMPSEPLLIYISSIVRALHGRSSYFPPALFQTVSCSTTAPWSAQELVLWSTIRETRACC